MEVWSKSLQGMEDDSRDGIHATRERQFFESIDIKGFTCLDIGFNWGWWSSLFLKHAGQEGKVYAWEPTPFMFENYLNKWPFKNLKGYDYALSDVTGESDFNIYADDGKESAFNSLDLDKNWYQKNNAPKKKITVKTDTLDNWWMENNMPNVDFIKIDCEGHDLKVIKGGQKMLEQAQPTYVILGHNDEPISDFLKSLSYTDGNNFNQLELRDKVWTR
jgi:FkbM family methyltransferase